MRTKIIVGLVMAASAALAGAETYTLPDFALGWPGKDGNVWSSEVFLTNPGAVVVRVSNARFLPGVMRIGVPCYPPVVPYHEVPPYATVPLSSFEIGLELLCPAAALGGLAFDADGPVRITSRVVNVRQNAAAAPLLAGFGQEVPGFGPSDLTVAGAVYQLPALLWDPFRCGRPPLFETYLYIVNPGNDPVNVTLQESRDGSPGELVINGLTVPTPHTFTLGPLEWRQLKVEPAGSAVTVCMPPQVVDLFLVSSGGVAAIGAVVDRTSQDPRTVLPVRTSD